MALINQIKSKLLELEGGAFHRLCDDWLYKKGYENLNAIGMMQITDRVTTGTPDCLHIQADGKYIFSEYTVQQDQLRQKIEGDITKCFDEKKTGVPVEQISEIIVCYLGRLTTHYISYLKSKCEQKGVTLTLNGLDTISLSIQHRYPTLSEEHLSLPLDTGQLLNVDDFIVRYNKNELTTELSNKILFQDEALKEGASKLACSDFLLVTGPAGVGKTLYSVSLVKLIQEENPSVQVCCIFDKGADLVRDITARFSEPGEYLIFIDDANRLDHRLDYILHYLAEACDLRKYKIIATVRDYARDQVIKNVSKYTRIEEQVIAPLTDDQIKELLVELFDMNNYVYHQRIQEVAGGNARLAIMAAKVATKTQQIESIRNVASLYDDYFGRNECIAEVVNDKKLMASACAISFLRRIDKLNESHMQWLPEVFGIQVEEFWECVNTLHKREIVDLYEDEVVRISDQVLSTYLFYLTVFDNKFVSFSTLVKNFFPDFNKTIVDALNPVISAYDHKKIVDDIRSDILDLYKDIQANKSQDDVLQFLNSFWFVLPTESLLFSKGLVNGLECLKIDWELENFEASKNEAAETSIVNLLSKFRYFSESELKISFDLLLKYVEKSRPSLGLFIRELNETYNFKPDDWRYCYSVQKFVIDRLFEAMSSGENYLFSRLFIEASSNYLEVERSEHKWARGDSISIITFRLSPDSYLSPIRRRIFEGLSFLLREEKYSKYIVNVLQQHVLQLRRDGKEMAEADFPFISEYLIDALDNEDITHCLLVLDLCDHMNSLGIECPASWIQRFSNETTQLSDLLLEDRHEKRMLEMGHEEYQQYRRSLIADFFKNKTLSEFEHTLNACKILYKSLSGRDRDYSLKNGIETSLSVLSETHPDDYDRIISIYLDFDDTFGIHPHVVVSAILEKISSEDAWKLLSTKEYKWKQYWLSFYFSLLPDRDITAQSVELLITHFRITPHNELPNWIDFLAKYQSIEPNIFSIIARILVDKSESESNFARPLAHIYSTYSDLFGKWFDLFKSDTDLVYDCYIAAFKLDRHFDYSGDGLNLIYSSNKEFLFRLIDCIYEIEQWPSSHTSMPRLNFLWERDSYFEEIESYALYVFGKEEGSYIPHDNIFKNIFTKEGGGSESPGLVEKKISFIKKTIDRNIDNPDYICFMFSIAVKMGDEFKREVLAFFLERNSDFSVFERFEFNPTSRSWSGSLVPILEREKNFFLSILPLLNASEFLEHKAYIEKLIDSKIQHIEREKKRDYLESR